MFSKKNESSVRTTDFDVIIGSNSSLEGTLKSTGSIRIDGEMNGSTSTEGDVIIGQDAKTEGDIKSSNIEISGSVEGDITSDGCLKIFSTGSLFGNIEVKSFVIEEDGVFEGMCHINAKGLERRSKSKTKTNNQKTDDLNKNSNKQANQTKVQPNMPNKQNKIG